jgi:hypothetical protein
MSKTYDTTTLAGQIEAAFDYRGDVTVAFKDGSTFEGFIFNRDLDPNSGAAFIELYPKEKAAAPKRVEVSQIQSVALTGEDTAAGKSWADWQAKQKEKHA